MAIFGAAVAILAVAAGSDGALREGAGVTAADCGSRASLEGVKGECEHRLLLGWILHAASVWALSPIFACSTACWLLCWPRLPFGSGPRDGSGVNDFFRTVLHTPRSKSSIQLNQSAATFILPSRGTEARSPTARRALLSTAVARRHVSFRRIWDP